MFSLLDTTVVTLSTDETADGVATTVSNVTLTAAAAGRSETAVGDDVAEEDTAVFATTLLAAAWVVLDSAVDAI